MSYSLYSTLYFTNCNMWLQLFCFLFFWSNKDMSMDGSWEYLWFPNEFLACKTYEVFWCSYLCYMGKASIAASLSRSPVIFSREKAGCITWIHYIWVCTEYRVAFFPPKTPEGLSAYIVKYSLESLKSCCARLIRCIYEWST